MLPSRQDLRSYLSSRNLKRLLAAFCALSLILSTLWVFAITGSGGSTRYIASVSTSSSTGTRIKINTVESEPSEAVKAPQAQLQPEQPATFRIPRIVHFTSRSEILRSEYRPMMEQWMTKYPDLEFYLWRDADAICLARSRYPRWLGSLDGSGNWLQTPLERSDVTRVLALHALGGLYLDLDTVPVADLTHLFDRPIAGAMFATEPPEHATLLFGLDSLVSNAVMFSTPGHPFLTDYFHAIETIARRDKTKRSNSHAPQITGPLVMQEVYERYETERNEASRSSPEYLVHLFQPEVFCPQHDPGQNYFFKTLCNATALHTMSDLKRTVCIQLWSRNFSQSKLRNATLAVHQFSHISSVQYVKSPTYFNASQVFPRLRYYAQTVPTC